MARMKDLSCIGLQMSGNKDEGVLLGTVRPSEQPPGRELWSCARVVNN